MFAPKLTKRANLEAPHQKITISRPDTGPSMFPPLFLFFRLFRNGFHFRQYVIGNPFSRGFHPKSLEVIETPVPADEKRVRLHLRNPAAPNVLDEPLRRNTGRSCVYGPLQSQPRQPRSLASPNGRRRSGSSLSKLSVRRALWYRIRRFLGHRGAEENFRLFFRI